MIVPSLSLMAQQRWGGNVDEETLHFGFSFHYVASDFKVFKNANWQANPEVNNDMLWLEEPGTMSSLDSIYSPYVGGEGVGLLADLRLGKNANLRFSPTILFANKAINYGYIDTLVAKTVKASLMELPLTFKFKSDRKNNYKVYVLAGGKYSLNVIPKKKLDDGGVIPVEKMVKLKPGFFSYEFGLGVDIYFEYFKMSPEIKWSQSFSNVLDKSEATIFTTPIDRLLLHSIQFSLLFE